MAIQTTAPAAEPKPVTGATPPAQKPVAPKAVAPKAATPPAPKSVADTKADSPKADGRSTRAMTDEHKASLAAGRAMGLVVRRYLELVGTDERRRGRPVTPESIEKQLASIEKQLATASPLKRLQLLQDREDAKNKLAARSDAETMKTVEREFIAVAKEYADRKRIGYQAWRAAGVSASVLKEAGITRS